MYLQPHQNSFGELAGCSKYPHYVAILIISMQSGEVNARLICITLYIKYHLMAGKFVDIMQSACLILALIIKHVQNILYNVSTLWPLLFFCEKVMAYLTHILKCYYTGAGAIIQLSQCHWCPEEYVQIDLLNTLRMITQQQRITAKINHVYPVRYTEWCMYSSGELFMHSPDG